MLKRTLAALAVTLSVGLASFRLLAPAVVEKRLNGVEVRPAYRPSEQARALHRRLRIADLHADTLLWDRDLLDRGSRGHVDVPRLIEGNVALEGFTVVTKVPAGQNLERNDDRSDRIGLLAVAEGWPVPAWTRLKERALYQAARLHRAAAASGGRLAVIRTAADLEAYLARRERDRAMTAGFLGLEGAHALEGDLGNLDALFDAGFRMMAPTHFFDNDLGGSAHGIRKGGLTEKGREMIRRMEARRMIVDLAHASPRLIAEAVALAARPVVVSHTGVRGTCDNTRNLDDEAIRGIAGTGGLIGIGYFEAAVCGLDGKAVARALRYTADRIGVDHVALGSDFDGAVTVPFDTTGLVEVTDALMDAGFSDTEIEKVMGGNVLRLLAEMLP